MKSWMVPTSIALVASISMACQTEAAPRPEIAITVDDLPVHAPYPPGVTAEHVGRQMIAALKSAHVPSIGFVNGVRLETNPDTQAVLEQWRKAGFLLGNHTWSHRHLSEMTLAQFEEELTKDEPVLEKLGQGTDWRWFRYPFLDEGKDEAQRVAARQMLAKHGYRVAHVTMSFSDWAFTPAYARCSAAANHAAVAKLERMYMDSARENLAVARESAHKLYARDIPYVLLMHISALSARMMPQVIRLYRNAGFRLVSVAQAERDPVYRSYANLALPAPASQQQLAKEKGVTLPQATDLTEQLAAMCPGGPTATNP